MGSPLSRFIDEERATWKPHDLIVPTSSAKSAALASLSTSSFQAGSKVTMYFSERSYKGYSYQHWFLLDEKGTRAFSYDVDGPLYAAAVRIMDAPTPATRFGDPFTLTPQVLERFVSLLGMTSFSLCLRNTEHVVYYVRFGRWVSRATLPLPDATIFRDAKAYMRESNALILLNTSPTVLVKERTKNKCKIYSELERKYTFSHSVYSLEDVPRDAQRNSKFIGNRTSSPFVSTLPPPCLRQSS